MRLCRLFLLLLLPFATLGCAEPEEPGSGLPEPGAPMQWPITLGMDQGRPAEVSGPAGWTGWTGADPLPVIFVLHGYGASAAMQETFIFRFTDVLESERFLLVLPEGTTDPEGKQFWNATPACCDFHGSEVDDVAYLRSLLAELESQVAIDTDRVYFTGHSNGAFMSFRMACEHPGLIAGIMGLAGSSWNDAEDCGTGAAVSVLDVHGDLDDSVPYEGRLGEYPGAAELVERWAQKAHCDAGAAVEAEALDLVTSIDGAETEVLQHREGCQAGLAFDLWTVRGGGHVPFFNDRFAQTVVPWLLSRSRTP